MKYVASTLIVLLFSVSAFAGCPVCKQEPLAKQDVVKVEKLKKQTKVGAEKKSETTLAGCPVCKQEPSQKSN